ncbi:hypothetical protein EV652_112139 [Kribbella steppae]|uniref:Uncharacterized protein n=1 Tax=Kribbella steppae TaxID=2512223 RepID=A0A4R2H449_9ACTN|nr:hypothetical protein [Kribbella steppae]TCO20393.1 hypothetical protein EV652_112139 [Kribbella steppae]
MGTKERRGEPWVVMRARRFGFGRNRLRRRVDRIESMLFLGAVVLALLAVPIAAGVGSSVGNSLEHSAAQRRAELRQVIAVALEDAPLAIGVAPGQATSTVRVGWEDGIGHRRQAMASVAIGTKIGAEVIVWLDRSGAVVAPPKQPGNGTAVGSVVGLSVVMATWLLLCGLFRLARVPLDRRTARDWEREWAEVSPRWTRRQT